MLTQAAIYRWYLNDVSGDVNDAGGKFAPDVNDTGGAPRDANIFVNF
jgi:hypothetical protein